MNPTQVSDGIAPATLYFFDELESTNTFSTAGLKDGSVTAPSLVVARSQTRGRGQRERTWVSATGNLTATWNLNLGADPFETMPLLPKFSLRVALSVAQTLKDWLSAVEFKIKWPNDLIVADCKVGGVLIETVTQGNLYAAVGLGLNVNASIGQLPIGTSNLRPGAIGSFVGKPIDLTELVLRVSEGIFKLSSIKDCEFPSSDFQAVQWGVGSLVEMVQPDDKNHDGRRAPKTSRGRVSGVGTDGSLVVETSSGMIQVQRSDQIRYVMN